MTKYLVVIGDGMSDLPLKELGGKTPLAAAATPNLDWLARNGLCGWTRNTPAGLEPGSDVAAMSIFGSDPKKYYTGRGPLEAASLGVKIKPGEVAFRCNLVSLESGQMKDFTADHISTSEAKSIFKLLNAKLGTKNVRFYAGLSYRNLLIMQDDRSGSLSRLKTTPPHDITGKPIKNYLPQGKTAECLISLMNESEVLLHGRKTKATMIWPWGQGKAPRMASFSGRFGKRAAIITAVHLLKGLGKILRMKIIDVPGATGYLDTNYKGKAEYALRALRNNDVVFVHVEAPDEAGHEGDVRKKIRAIEDFDRLVIGTIINKLRIPHSALRILVLPDHPTPIKLMTHTSAPVPFVVYPSSSKGQVARVKGFNEKEIGKSKVKINEGYKLIGRFLKDEL
jgi:2,3-bisphosphoglycerate-independent phosphoglycerate mutase